MDQKALKYIKDFQQKKLIDGKINYFQKLKKQIQDIDQLQNQKQYLLQIE